MSNFWNKNLLTLIIALGAVTIGFAQQPKINSPYSRIGLGDLADPNFATVRALGGTSAAFHDPSRTNLVNPASLTYLEYTSFEVGAEIRRSYFSSGDEKVDLWSGNLSYFSLSFPTRNPINRAVNPIKSPFHWAMNVSLVPFTNVGYNIETTDVLPNQDTVQYNYQGKGGTYKVVWGNGLRYNNLSLGLNLGYMFGKISNIRQVNFLDVEASYYDLFQDDFSVSGIVWNLGAQYDYVFKKLNDKGEMVPDGRRLTFGAYGNSKNSYNIKQTSLNRRINNSYQVIDTLNSTTNSDLKGKLPAEFGVGVAYTKSNKWRLGVDYSMAKWSGYRNDAKASERLVDSWRVAVGGAITPDYRSYNSYFKRVTYNFGAFYGKDPRGSENMDLLHYGITAGLILPVIKKEDVSYVNFTFELGRMGIENGLEETYGKLTLGFTLNKNDWFLKRKFY